MPADPFRTAERDALRETVRAFVRREVLPAQNQWAAGGELPRSLHRRAAEAGLTGLAAKTLGYPS